MIIFLENMMHELDRLELIDGTHKLTLSFGLGSTYETAEKALSLAKKAKTPDKNENLIQCLL
jgi:hypothetical protein